MPTATDKKMQMLEVFSFLDDERPEARSMACEYSASISKQHQSVFLENNNKPIHDIMKLIDDNPVTSNHAISCLINLTSDIAIVHAMATKEFIQSLVIQLLLPQNVNADLVCMLLNNLSRNEIVADVLLPDEEQKGTQMIDNMLEVFNKKEYTFNKSASFNFLGGVFANISTSPKGCKFFLGKSTVDSSVRLSKLVCFIEHPDVMRRGGVISTLKNVAYGINIDGGNGLDLMLDDSLNMLVYILLPLSGSEDYDEEVNIIL